MWLKVKFLTCAVLFSLFRTSFGVEQGSSDVRVKEGSDVVLPCSPGNQDLNYVRFEWHKVDPNGQKEVFVADGGIHSNDGSPSGQDPQFKGRVSHFGDELQHGNASIKIQNTKLEDSGNYTCYFPRLNPPQIFYVQLVVDGILKDRSGSPGVAPAPGIKIVKATNNWWQLQCDVQGASSKPKVEWKNSDGKVLLSLDPQVTESKGRYDVTLLTTVDQTGLYHCVVTQEELHHQVHAKTFVHISGEKEKKEGKGKEQAPEIPGQNSLITGLSIAVVVAAVAAAAAFALWIQRWLRGSADSKADSKMDPEAVPLSTTGSNVFRVLGEKGRDVILWCFLEGEDLTRKAIIWKKRDQKGDQTVFFYNAGNTVTSTFLGQDPQFEGRVSHFRDELQHGIAAIKIQSTKMEDSGKYFCDFRGSKKTFCVELLLVEPNN